MEMNVYQKLASRTDQKPITRGQPPYGPEALIPLLGLAGEVGEILSEYKKFLRDGESHKLFDERITEELGDLLWYLTNVATKFGLDLDVIAEQNLAKCRDRWGATTEHRESLSVPHPGFDHAFPEKERLPRHLEIEIKTVSDGSPRKIQTFVNGAKFGDDLTDNAYKDDGYRFHDVFHLACATMLGWSPVVRALLRRKRKSDPNIDDIEDGGRAIAIEEGISAMVFSYAEDHNFLEGAEGVSYDLLRTIKGMTSHLEVSRCSAGQWEQAIVQAFKIWRAIRESGGGRIIGDLDLGTFAMEEAI